MSPVPFLYQPWSHAITFLILLGSVTLHHLSVKLVRPSVSPVLSCGVLTNASSKTSLVATIVHKGDVQAARQSRNRITVFLKNVRNLLEPKYCTMISWHSMWYLSPFIFLLENLLWHLDGLKSFCATTVLHRSMPQHPSSSHFRSEA